jgi:hypothetical protein
MPNVNRFVITYHVTVQSYLLPQTCATQQNPQARSANLQSFAASARIFWYPPRKRTTWLPHDILWHSPHSVSAPMQHNIFHPIQPRLQHSPNNRYELFREIQLVTRFRRERGYVVWVLKSTVQWLVSYYLYIIEFVTRDWKFTDLGFVSQRCRYFSE